ncbi:hypothetical protein [Dysgonomonas macrotermitis]|uniref:Major capsid protein n=1 Tax=Dysgonomonas macrotermitis TaxID=1346286 RepID=A0A1M5AGH7_9BACT|nr:hypothetical protein [Dysgonomonas macrotermitis]SHF29245.1 hypothetical protein SAMN05444362_10541 [Dysgonomonas macrotermitis]
MSKTITIGGDRLGTGNKMKQSMHGYGRSNHDLGFIWRSTMAPGTLVPFYSKPMLIDDTFDIKLTADVMTHPTIGPLFGSFKLQMDMFLVPIRLYQAQLHNNKMGIAMNMASVKLPQIQIFGNSVQEKTEDDGDVISEPFELQQINPSSLLSYLGIKGWGAAKTDLLNSTNIMARFNALPYLSYFDIYKNYYANKQEEIGAMISAEDIVEPEVVSASITWGEAGIPGSIPSKIYSEQILTATGVGISLRNVSVTMNTTNSDAGARTILLQNLLQYSRRTVTLADNGLVTIQGQFNRQWDGWYIRTIDITPDPTDVPNVEPQIVTFPLQELDDMREIILEGIRNTAPFTISEAGVGPNNDQISCLQKPLMRLNNSGVVSPIRSKLPMEGLLLKTYLSDKFNNWLNYELIGGDNGIAAVTSVDVSNGKLNLDTLNLAKKVYNMMSRIAVTDGTYYSYLEVVYDSKPFQIAETPMYVGGMSQEIIFTELQSSVSTGTQPLGTLAGKGTLGGKKKGGNIRVRAAEPSYLIGIVSITPRLDYSQGNEWDVNLETMDDFHKSALDGIGYQDLIGDQLAFWTTSRDDNGLTAPLMYAPGKVPAWIDYMTEFNKCYGNFANPDNEMFMTLNRRYQHTEPVANATQHAIEDMTTYIDPSKYNYIFAQTDISAQNFWVQIGLDISARRKMSAKQIPNL